MQNGRKLSLPIGRRAALAGGLSAFAWAGQAGAAVKIIRGSSAEAEAGAIAPDAQNGVRIIRPGRQSDRQVEGPVGEGAQPAFGDIRPAGPPSAALAELLDSTPTRTLTLDHAHTGERLAATYWRDGALDPAPLAEIRWFLRDWRRSRPSPLSVDLLNVLWAVQGSLAAGGPAPPLRVLSAYRTRQTNEELRAAGIAGVAKDSFHLRGMAADIHCPQRAYGTLSSACTQLAPGGIGRYRRSGFIHLDAGPSRTWVG